MINLEIRKAALEAWGYELKAGDWSEFSRRYFYIYLNGAILENSGYFTNPDTLDWVQRLPAIESDPAVSEPMFLEFCAKHGLGWIMVSMSDEKTFALSVIKGRDPSPLATIEAETPSLARAKAIIEVAKHG